MAEAPGPFGVELDAGLVGQRLFERTVIGCRRLVGDALDGPLREPYDQGLVPLGRIGKLPVDPGGVGMGIECRFGDVDDDGLW